MGKLLKILVLLQIILVSELAAQNSIYSHSVTAIDGFLHSISSFKGLKIWIVVLPSALTAKNVNYLSRIDSIAVSNASRMITIVIPSNEDGYQDGDKAVALTKWYRVAVGSGIILTKPLYMRKGTEDIQSGLYQWLTRSKQNGRIDADVSGSGSMYFVSAEGELTGAFGPEAMFSNKVINLSVK